MMKRFFVLVLAGLTLSACGTPQKYIWIKEGASRQNLNEDDYSCSKDAILTGDLVYVGFGMTGRAPNYRMYLACMMSKGWNAQPV